MLIDWAVVVLLSLIIPRAFCAFYTPQQKGRGVWKVGDVELIKYGTSYTNYTIAIWQQSLVEGSASLGPIIYQTSNGPGSQFNWLVQTYDFDLEVSNVFFLWLFPGDASVQGNQSIESMPSSFFNITKEAVSVEPSQVTTSTEPPPAATSSQTTSTSNSPSPVDSSKETGGLSTGATAGIGVGAGVGGLAILVLCVLLYKRLSKQQKTIKELQQMQQTQWNPPRGEWKPTADSRTYELPGPRPPEQNEPVELPGWARSRNYQ